MKAVVTGATGFIGRHLCNLLLREGHTVTALSRDAARASATLDARISAVSWEEKSAWQKAVSESDATFHLAGEQISGQRWTPAFKQKVLTSRVETTRALAEVVPKVFVSASAVGYYGDQGNRAVTEGTPPGNDFLADVCIAWEQATSRAKERGMRVAIPRIGIVLGRDGGPLQTMLYPTGGGFSPWKLGLGGPLGSGKQYVPWVHIDDLARLLLFAAEQDMQGAMNAVAPNPITNSQLSGAIGRSLNRPALLPTPAFALKAILGDFSYALLYSQRILPVVAQERGFVFQFPDIDTALADLLKESGSHHAKR